MKLKKVARPRGRPRAFDCDQALDRALQLFWQKGYEGTSLSDLTEAMGINRPSLYAAFGNKEELYRRALERYTRGTTEQISRSLEGLSARAGVHKLLVDAVENFTGPGAAGCCFMTQAPLNGPAASMAAQRESEFRRDAIARLLQQRFEAARATGELRSDVSAEDLARYYSVVLQGIALQAQHGGDREQLLKVADLSMSAFPAAPLRP